jgi:hypothetical protein
MSRDEIIRLLKANVGPEVKIVNVSGDVVRILVVNFAEEGVVGEREEHGTTVPHGNRLEDVEDILPRRPREG